MSVLRFSYRIALLAWLMFSLGLFYWGGLLLEAFGISIAFIWLCRLGALVWGGTSIIFWQAVNITKPSHNDTAPSPFIGLIYTLILAASALFDSWLCLRGVCSLNPWILVPLGHLALCVVVFSRFRGHQSSSFPA